MADMTDQEVDAAMLPIRNKTQIDRLNVAECRAVFRAMEAAGLIGTVDEPATAPATSAVA